MKTGKEVDLKASNPFTTLGISIDANDAQIREAYLRCVKAHPPEQDAEAFERIRDAYAFLKDPHNRIRLVLMHADPDLPIASLLDQEEQERCFLGPQPWLELLKGRK